jgi:hypothetical protein
MGTILADKVIIIGLLRLIRDKLYLLIGILETDPVNMGMQHGSPRCGPRGKIPGGRCFTVRSEKTMALSMEI